MDIVSFTQRLIVPNSTISAISGHGVAAVFGPGDDDCTDDVEASAGLIIYIPKKSQVIYVWWIKATAKEEDTVDSVMVQDSY